MRITITIAKSISSTIFRLVMASEKGSSRWIYSKDDLENSPSRKDGIDKEKELGYRQQAANLIQDMGIRLSVNQLTINTAIVYMHRFYVYHSFKVFNRYHIAPTSLFLAAKVEEQPKKLEHVIKVCHACLYPNSAHLDTMSDQYLKQAQELVQNELIVLQTLGFDISVDHPHTHVVKSTQQVKASRDLSQMAYFMATNSLHLTTFCLLYKPTVVAAMCIHLSCKWSDNEVPLSSEGKRYWEYMDSSITEPFLNTIVSEFLKILNHCPSKLRKLKNYRPQDIAASKEREKTVTVNSIRSSSSMNSDAASKPVNNDVNHSSGSSTNKPQLNSTVPSSQSASAPAHPTPPPPKRSSLSYDEYRRLHMKPVVKQQPPPAKQQPPPITKAPLPPRQLPPSQALVKSEPTSNTVYSNKPTKSDDSMLAITQDIDGRIKSEKSMHRTIKDEHPAKQEYPKSDSRRHHVDKPHSKELEQPLDSKRLHEYYTKRPDKLYNILRHRLQHFLPTATSEEKHYYQKLSDHKKRKQQQAEAHKLSKATAIIKQENSNGVSQSPSTEHLKIKIKLPPPPEGHPSSKTGSSSGSGSDYASPRPRKRGHHSDTSSQPEAKLYKRSDEHHRHQHNNNNSPANQHISKQRHKQSRSSHHQSKVKHHDTIDEATFQKALSDAKAKVQQSGGSIPSNMKRPVNGGSQYFGGKQQPPQRGPGGFDPSTPVSAQMPDNIFEDDHHDASNDNLEPGEIVESVRYPSSQHYNKKLNKRIKPTVQ